MRVRIGVIAGVLIVAAIGGTAAAARGFSQGLFAYPGYEAQWQKGTGVPDGTKSQQGLLLEKVDPLADTTQGSGVSFFNIEGTALSQLGYDIKDGSVCGVFPRYRVRVPNGASDTTSDDWNYLFECQSGTHTPLNNGWTTVSFSDIDAVAETEGAPPFTFGTTISTLGLLFHLGSGVGSATLDNLNISGTLIGKPGR